MAIEYNRQYVGARYVPKFFENPDGSWNWAAGFQYEPLTMVQYGNNTYTSKKLVPATVGTPNLNLDYWATTGNYNGALQEIQNELNQLKSKFYYFIGDSYGTTSEPTWATLIPQYMGLKPNQYYVDARPSSGFSTSCPVQFVNILNSYGGDKNQVTDIVVLGGANDAYYSGNDSSIVSSISSFMTAAHSNFPNAKVHVGEIGWTWGNDRNGQYGKMRFLITLEAYKKCVNFNARYLSGVEFSLHDSALFIGDGFHPNQAGQVRISANVAQALTTGYCDEMKMKQCSITLNNGVTLQGIFNQVMKDGMVTVFLRATNIANNPVIAFSTNLTDNDIGNYYVIGELNESLCDTPLFGHNAMRLRVQCGVIVAGSSTRETKFSDAIITIDNKTVLLYFMDNYGDTINVNGITAIDGMVTIPAVIC